MRRIYVSVLVLSVLMSIGMAQAEPEFGQVWHKSDLNPVFVNPGEAGTWNSGGIGPVPGGHAMWDGENYRIYIFGRGPDPDNSYSIGVFTSPHLDSGWVEYENNPVFERDPDGWDMYGVTTPYVIKDGDTYKMWYSGGDENYDVHIGYAESPDGYSWSRLETPVFSPVPESAWESLKVTRPSVHIENDSTYMMWYNAESEGIYWQIGYAQSTDGIDWERVQTDPVFSLESGWASQWNSLPKVLRTEAGFTMWYSGSTSSVFDNPAKLGSAVSTDGINWQQDRLHNPVIRQGSTGNWDDTAVVIMGIFLDDGKYKILYFGIDSDWEYGSFGVATYSPTIVPAGDVSGTWTKAGSPIRVQGEITIPNGETLTIEPGTTVEFLGHDPLNVQGQILAVGTAEEPIRFTVDDTLGFYDIAGSEGVWGGIRFDGTPATNDSSLLVHCELEFAKTFSGTENPWGKPGGAVYITNFSNVRIDGCLIQYNQATGNAANYWGIGAGIAITSNANPKIVNNLIQFNTSNHLWDPTGATGGGIFVYDHCDPLISGNTFRNNRTWDAGGGLSIWEYCDPVVSNNLIVNNEARGNDGTGGVGGGVAIGLQARPVFINNTIVNNTAGGAADGFWFNGGDAVFINTIIAGNQDIVEPLGYEIGTWNMSGHTLDFRNSCLEGGLASINWGSGVGTVNFVESLSIDPRLRFDYKLSQYLSQCIGAGTSSCEIDGVTYHAPSTDLNGDPCPSPAGSSPDMGAFELDRSGHHIHSGWNWWHWAESPVLMPGPNGTWDDANIFAPDVLFYEEQYHMWYVGSDGDRYKIGHATSDNGVDWLRDPANPVLTSEPTSWQAQNLNVPRVLLVEDTLHMWFWTDGRAGHATSTDGISWTFTPDPVMEGTLGTWDGGMVVIADVIYRDSVFHAWYTGESSGVYAIGYATSTDGIVWDKLADPVFESSASGWDSRMYYASSVVWNGEQYQMWYCAKENTEPARIGRAYSSDGINWIRASTGSPDIGYGEPGSWNAAASFYPAVLLDQGRYKVWFNGVPSVDSTFRIGYASMEPVATDPGYTEIPQSFMLSQNYPNPFNPMTHIRYSLPNNGDIRLVVYDLLGREIVELVNEFRSVGNYATTWYGIDRNGNQVSTGVYFARLEAGRNVDVIKMLYLK